MNTLLRVNITLASTNKFLVNDELSDEFGAVKTIIEGSALFLISAKKEGFKSETSDTFIYCAPDSCDSCSQTLYITMEPVKGCDEDMFAEITVTDAFLTSEMASLVRESSMTTLR